MEKTIQNSSRQLKWTKGLLIASIVILLITTFLDSVNLWEFITSFIFILIFWLASIFIVVTIIWKIFAEKFSLLLAVSIVLFAAAIFDLAVSMFELYVHIQVMNIDPDYLQQLIDDRNL